MGRYDALTREQAIALLERRDRERRYGLVWERDEIEADQAINHDFVAFDIVPDLCLGDPPWDDIIIEGDNWDALRALGMTHAGRIKCMYIDPPYNTGNKNWVYNDAFFDPQSRFAHSTWIEFIYNRISNSIRLLSYNGVLISSIGKREMANLYLILNDMFGENNVMEIIVWQNKYTVSNDAKLFSRTHEYLICATHNTGSIRIQGERKSEKITSRYKNPDNDPRGPWKSTPLHAKSGSVRGFKYRFKNSLYWSPPTGTFPRYSVARLAKMEENNEIYFGKSGKSQPSRKTFLKDVDAFEKPNTFWTHEFGGNTHEASQELKKLSLGDVFENPKPTKLVRRLLDTFMVGSGDITLDFFAGSGTTAHAVMALNAEDGGDRRFIMVSNTEATADEPDKNLCRDVLRERVRRAAEKLGLQPRVAYLRAATIPMADLDWDDGLTDERAWTLIRMMHGLPVAPLAMTDGIAAAPLPEGGTIAYLDQLSDAGAERLAALAVDGPVIAYAWAPGQVRVRFEDDPRIEPRPVIDSLLKRFRP